MNLELRDGIGARAVIVWQRERGRFTRLPATARVMLGLFLFAALLLGLHTALPGKDASLQLNVQHSMRSARLSLWVDGDLAYSQDLVGNSKRKFGLIPSVQGSLSKRLAVAAGIHLIKVQIVADGGKRENTISGDFAHHGQRTLSVSASRADLFLKWQSLTSQSTIAGAESSSGSNGWFSRYASTLMMTVAGSIVSALAGFALRELPKQMVSRPSEAPKGFSNQPSSD
jgi:hypothetical protein